MRPSAVRTSYSIVCVPALPPWSYVSSASWSAGMAVPEPTFEPPSHNVPSAGAFVKVTISGCWPLPMGEGRLSGIRAAAIGTCISVVSGMIRRFWRDTK